MSGWFLVPQDAVGEIILDEIAGPFQEYWKAQYFGNKKNTSYQLLDRKELKAALAKGLTSWKPAS